MSNEQLRESSLFSRYEGEKAADARFIIDISKKIASGHHEITGNVISLPAEKEKQLKKVTGRLKVIPQAKGESQSSELKPISVEDAERSILEAFDAPEPSGLLFLDEPEEEAKPNAADQSSVGFHNNNKGEEPFSAIHKFDQDSEEEALPVLGSTYSTATSHGSDLGAEPPAPQDEISQETISQVLDKIETVVCTVCQERNFSNSNYCAHCGSLINFCRREHSGYSKISQEPTAMSWTPNQDIRAYLIAINDDGTEGKRIPIEFMETIIGREMDSPFPTDSFLSPKHAKLTVRNSQLFIQDLNSLNGTFIKLRQEKVIESGDTFLMGRQVLSFEKVPDNHNMKLRSPDGTRKMGSPAADSSFRLLQIGIGGILQNVYCLPKAGAQLGRERGDIIFPHDKFMSSRHAQIFRRSDDKFILADLNSSNGTWIKIWESTPLETQDYIFMGQQLFRVLIDR